MELKQVKEGDPAIKGWDQGQGQLGGVMCSLVEGAGEFKASGVEYPEWCDCGLPQPSREKGKGNSLGETSLGNQFQFGLYIKQR